MLRTEAMKRRHRWVPSLHCMLGNRQQSLNLTNCTHCRISLWSIWTTKCITVTEVNYAIWSHKSRVTRRTNVPANCVPHAMAARTRQEADLLGRTAECTGDCCVIALDCWTATEMAKWVIVVKQKLRIHCALSLLEFLQFIIMHRINTGPSTHSSTLRYL